MVVGCKFVLKMYSYLNDEIEYRINKYRTFLNNIGMYDTPYWGVCVCIVRHDMPRLCRHLAISFHNLQKRESTNFMIITLCFTYQNVLFTCIDFRLSYQDGFFSTIKNDVLVL